MRVFQCAVMGSGGVGKSAITVRFINGSYLEWYDPTIEDSYRKQFNVDNQPCLLEILDTGEILCQRDSFEEVLRTYDAIQRIKLSEGGRIIPIVIVGNKSDLIDEREVDTTEGEKLSLNWNCSYYETSARTSININSVFEDIVRQLRKNELSKRQEKNKDYLNNNYNISRRKRIKTKKCVIL
uniref:Ras family, other n=1 Tax=Kwoniella pini CBS 10737 TaxID=1296096 RepID=A0A1B9I6A7_9TREE|nr:uncharacterized protein I206_03075 [Kwoniella pini CBS 10737]OCF51011.1 hypothetical protein I206_03075 [Kwoniella pini CBS 10737]